MAFQMVDDVLDVVATDEELGKPAGHDMAEGVYTLPVLRTLAGGDAGAAELRCLLGGELTAEDQARALALVRGSSGVAEAAKAAHAQVEEAVAALAPLPPSAVVESLAGAARHLLTGIADRT